MGDEGPLALAATKGRKHEKSGVINGLLETFA